MKLTKLILALPLVCLPLSLTAGCSESEENVVLEAPAAAELEEEAYEAESYGTTDEAGDESQN